MSFSVGCRRGLDPVLLWFWCRPAATAPIRPLAWEPPYATSVALEKTKRPKKKKKKKRPLPTLITSLHFNSYSFLQSLYKHILFMSYIYSYLCFSLSLLLDCMVYEDNTLPLLFNAINTNPSSVLT